MSSKGVTYTDMNSPFGICADCHKNDKHFMLLPTNPTDYIYDNFTTCCDTALLFQCCFQTMRANNRHSHFDPHIYPQKKWTHPQ